MQRFALLLFMACIKGANKLAPKARLVSASDRSASGAARVKGLLYF
jgi:hypothetical protein